MMGLVDSTILVMATVASFGIQLSVNRNVATQKNWWGNYKLAQSARLVVGFLIVAYGTISFLIQKDPTKFIYLAAPLIALNGDYALYGNGKPVHAAMLSFFRVAIPNLGILAASNFMGKEVIYLYIVLAGLGILIAGFLSSLFNKVHYIYTPRWDFHKVYIKYYKVGLFQLASVLMITGILTLAKGFYSVVTIGLVYGGLKYFEVFKGGLRILVQAFFKELSLEKVSLKIDKVGMMGGMLISIPFLVYPHTTLTTIYGDAYKGYEFIIIIFGVAMLTATLSTSAGTIALLKKLDNLNLKAYLISLFLAVLVMIIFSFLPSYMYGIPLGVLVGELSLLSILGYNLGGFRFYIDRIKFLLKLLPLIIICILIKWISPNELYALLGSIVFFSLSIIVIYRKLIFGSVTKDAQ